MVQKLSPRDPSSFSRPENVAVTNLHLDLKVDFVKKIFTGNVDLSIEKHNKEAKELILDSKDLKISSIIDKKTDAALKFKLDEKIAEFGQKLTIELPENAEETFLIGITYETSQEASGLQWLSPAQTAGKKHPYVFSQFQPIHARSVVPCQDTPGVKAKYSATITAPADLTVVMSAVPKSSEEINANEKKFTFIQNIPIPSYLIAIAVGALQSRKLGPRSHVWAEKEIIDSCAFEFSETEHQLKTAEDICGPYVWGIYDLLVLPPSFAFGGMENPCLTFITPTLLAGDKSLANVVAHEIAHSWTGNLITNRNFEHFWLNEGFTVFVERKIKGRLTSELQQDFDAAGGLNDLIEAIGHLGNDNVLTKLVVSLDGVHPDDAFSSVPYEKGYIFLRYLEQTVGGPSHFEPFLKAYFDEFKYKSIDTSDFKNYFEHYFKDSNAIKSINWTAWLYNPGMPSEIPKYNTTLEIKCKELLKNFLEYDESKTASPITPEIVQSLSTEQKIHLLQKLLQEDKPLSHKKVEHLDAAFGFPKVKNSEIKFRWLRVGIRAHWLPSVAPTLDWVNEVGRMKYVRPLYRDLYAWEDVRQQTIENFQNNKEKMMHVVAYTVSKDLHLIS